MWASVGVDVADDEVEVTEDELDNFEEELEERTELEGVETTELEVVLGAEVPNGEHTAPTAETSLKSSPDEPLTAPNLAPATEATEALPL